MTQHRASTTARGYGHAHQQERERHRPDVEAGRAYCTEPVCLHPTRWIPPTAPWDLAHNRTTGGYRGPAHRRCNRAEGARWKQLLARGFRIMPTATTTRADTPTDDGPTDGRWNL